MNEAKDVLRIVGIILLGIFVLVVGIPWFWQRLE